MVTEADIAAATHIRLPTRFAYQTRDGVVDASCLARASETIGATITSHRSRGPDFKRLKAVTADGATYVVDLISNGFDFKDLAPTAVIRGSGASVIGGVLEIEDARFRETEARISEGTRLKTAAHASWRTGINYVSELEAVADAPVRPGLLITAIAATSPNRVHSLMRFSRTISMGLSGRKLSLLRKKFPEIGRANKRGRRILLPAPREVQVIDAAEFSASCSLMESAYR